MNNQEIRQQILRVLYEVFQQDPFTFVDGHYLEGVLSIPRTTLLANIRFLEQEGYIEVNHFIGGEFISKITSKGIRLIEDKPDAKHNSNIVIFAQNIIGSNVGSSNSTAMYNANQFSSLTSLLEHLVALGRVDSSDAEQGKAVISEIDAVIADNSMPVDEKRQRIRALWGKLSESAWKLTTHPLVVQLFGEYLKNHNLW